MQTSDRAHVAGPLLSSVTAMPATIAWVTFGSYGIVPRKVAPLPPDYTVADRRLPGGLASEALAMYRALFWKEVVDEETGEVETSYQGPQIKRAFEDALEAYLATGREFDPMGFRSYLADEYAEKRAGAWFYVDQLGILLDKVELLGLTSAELDVSGTGISPG